MSKVCFICGKRYEVGWARRRSNKYCSDKCKGVAKRKTQRPTPDQLREMIWRVTLKEIGEIYGVTYTAVRYWCEQLGIERPTRKDRARIKESIKHERDGKWSYK